MNISTGQKIKELRKKAGLSSAGLAQKAELSPAYISKLEGGEYKSMSLKTSKHLADGFGLSLKAFLETTGFLEQSKQSLSFQSVVDALRSNGFSDNQVQDIRQYAQFIKSKTNQGK